ncbi:hypothetical protein B0H12DRAFT_958511, partial [Mycena haematopus]
LGSIVLDPGVKYMPFGDARDFLASEKVRSVLCFTPGTGWLLHRVPGSGKSSLIRAIAGDVSRVYCLCPLVYSSSKSSVLMGLMERVQKGVILLLEDLDATFTRSVSRTDNE